MENTIIDQVTLAGSIDYEMSIWGLFLRADIVVQAVILMLLLESFWCWAITFDKALRMRRVNSQAKKF